MDTVWIPFTFSISLLKKSLNTQTQAILLAPRTQTKGASLQPKTWYIDWPKDISAFLPAPVLGSESTVSVLDKPSMLELIQLFSILSIGPLKQFRAMISNHIPTSIRMKMTFVFTCPFLNAIYIIFSEVYCQGWRDASVAVLSKDQGVIPSAHRTSYNHL